MFMLGFDRVFGNKFPCSEDRGWFLYFMDDDVLNITVGLIPLLSRHK